MVDGEVVMSPTPQPLLPTLCGTNGLLVALAAKLAALVYPGTNGTTLPALTTP